RRRFTPCWVHCVLIGIALVGQGCTGGMHSDRSTEPTGTLDKDREVPKVSLGSTKRVADYSLAGPVSGEVGGVSFFKVSLGDAAPPTGTIRLIPSASNGDGGFNPPSMELGDTRRSASFSYIPTRPGVRTIAITNNG